MRRREECGAGTKKGTPCKAKVYVKGERCGIHGKSQQLPEKNNRKRAELVLADLGKVEPVEDPIAALEYLAGEAMRAVEIVRTKVASLTSVRYEGEHGEQIRGEVQVWLSLMARAESINAKIVSLDLYDRKLKVEEQQTNFFIDIFLVILKELGVDERKALPVVQKHMLPVIEGKAKELGNGA